MIILHKREIEKYLHLDARLTEGLQLIKDGIADQQPLGRTDDSEQMYHNVQCYVSFIGQRMASMEISCI